MSTTYYLVSWTDRQREGGRGRPPTTREYGAARSKQAAIRLADGTCPPTPST